MTALARAVVRFRYYIIAFWLIVAGLAIPRAARVTDVLETGGQSHRFTEAQLTRDIILESFERPIVSFMAVVVTGPGPDRQPNLPPSTRKPFRRGPSGATVAEPYATNAGQVTPWLRAAMNRGAARTSAKR